jgi:hypothetical protein
MAAPVRLLPFLDPAPMQIAFVDPKTGLMTDAWRRYFVNLERVIFGEWKDQAYDAANFTTRSALIAWNVIAANVSQLAIFQMGPFAVACISLTGTTVSSDIDILRIKIPTLLMVPTAGVSLFQAICRVKVVPAATEQGTVYTDNIAGDTSCTIQVERASGADFPAASANIQIDLQVIFHVQSVVIP